MKTITKIEMNIHTYLDAEKYLQNKQVYLKKEIVNNEFKTLAESDMVHQVGKVEIERINKTTITFFIQINDIETTMYEYKTDRELFSWILKTFIPVSELVNFYKNK